MDEKYLKETYLLDFNSQEITALFKKRNFDSVESVYNFVRDEIKFGYNIQDDIKASKVLLEGIGQCNTKAILLMAMLRKINIPCRLHGYSVSKELQKGAITELAYKKAPRVITHSMVEVLVDGTWLKLEGFILDKEYLAAIQNKFRNESKFIGYAVATDDLQHPIVDFKNCDTFIQSNAIVDDFGIYDNPDIFFKEHPQKLSPIKRFIYKKFATKRFNRNIDKIRRS